MMAACLSNTLQQIHYLTQCSNSEGYHLKDNLLICVLLLSLLVNTLPLVKLILIDRKIQRLCLF
jgi:hypothetical protein